MQTCIGKNFEKVLFDFKTCFYTLKTSDWVVLPGHSALLETRHSIVKGIDDDDHCYISEAFDKVWHKGFIHKLVE